MNPSNRRYLPKIAVGGWIEVNAREQDPAEQCEDQVVDLGPADAPAVAQNVPRPGAESDERERPLQEDLDDVELIVGHRQA